MRQNAAVRGTLRRTAIDGVGKPIRITGTYVGHDLVEVDSIERAEMRHKLSIKH